MFFYLYMLLSFFSLIVDAGVVPPGSVPYAYFVAAQNGLTSALVTCLLINGFVGFQLYEDGTPLSVWLLRVSSFLAFVLSFMISLATFMGWAGLGPTNTVGLFVVLYLLNAIQLFVYIVMQVLLVVRTLHDRWPLGHIAFGVFFFVVGQVLLYAVSTEICDGMSHYLDGLFFATICNLLGVMMVYKVCFPHFPSDNHACVAWRHLLTRFAVLGLDYPGGSRVLRRHEDEQLGGEGASARRRPTNHRLRRRPLRSWQWLRPPLLHFCRPCAILDQVLKTMASKTRRIFSYFLLKFGHHVTTWQHWSFLA